MKLNEWVEQNTAVEEWLTSVKGSSARQYGYRLKNFFDHIKMTPHTFLDLAKTESPKAKTHMNRWFNLILKNGKADNYAIFSESVIKSFLLYHEIKLRLPKREGARKYRRKVLRKEQIRKMVEAAPYIRDKALIVLAFQTGMSISDLLDLNYKDVKKTIEDKKAEHHIIEYIRGKKKIESKAVIGKDAINYLRQYINWRRERGNRLTTKTPLFTGVRDHELQQRLKVRNAEVMMRKIVVKAGITTYEEIEKYNVYGFHALRKAFSSVAKQNGVPFEQVEMSMGHSLKYDYDEYENEELVKHFKKAEPHLSISIDTREIEEKTEEHDETIRKQTEKIKELEEHVAKYEALETKVDAMAEYIEQKLKEEKSNAK